MTPSFFHCIYSILETETHALSLHTQGEVCRLENSAPGATSSTTPQGRLARIAFPRLFCNIFLVACANVGFLMLVSRCKHLKRGETGLRANCLPSILEQELQCNPFDGFGASKIQSHPSPKYTYEIT